jgi:hypothetical protein
VAISTPDSEGPYNAPLEGRAALWRVPLEAIVRPVKSNNGPYFTPDSSEFWPPRRGEVKHSLLVVANADLRYEHAKKRGPLTALLLAYNLFGDSFFEASGGLGGKTTGHFL